MIADEKYTLVLTNSRGEVVSTRVRRLPGTDLEAEEYGIKRAAGEMYRDAMAATRKWETRA